MKKTWTKVTAKLPEKEGYYKVKFKDGTEDQKFFRIKPIKNTKGFVCEKHVVSWK